MKAPTLALCAAIAIGCSAPPAAVASRAPAPPPARSAAVALPSPGASSSPAAPPSAEPAAASSPPAATEEPTRFPPPSFAPPFEKTAKPGDGAWTAMSEGAAGGAPILARTTVHTDAIKGHVYAAIVAVDLRRASLHLVAGTLEPKSTAVPAEHRPGLIPAEDQADLIAVINGGFMSKHGGYGMRIGEDTFLPPRDDACTIAILSDGSLRIGTWSALKAAEKSMAAYRQTPPCLVEKGVVHPTLIADPTTHRWGTSETGEIEVRRSALGLDDGGRTLFYGVGEWITPRALAEAMRAAGAVDVAEADINWSYTRFLFFGKPDPSAPLQVVSTLIPKMKYAPTGYVAKPSERDFFYLKRRP